MSKAIKMARDVCDKYTQDDSCMLMVDYGSMVVEVQFALEQMRKDTMQACGDFVYQRAYGTPFSNKTHEQLVGMLLDNISRVQEVLWDEDINNTSIEIPEGDKPEWEKSLKELLEMKDE